LHRGSWNGRGTRQGRHTIVGHLGRPGIDGVRTVGEADASMALQSDIFERAKASGVFMLERSADVDVRRVAYVRIREKSNEV
jgi:hypothetical protein